MDTKLGLVLSGGGAKGAYQAGILNYMADINLQPDMVSGTSIGALNGSIVSAQKNIKDAASIIHEIWQDLANNPPISTKDINKTRALIDVISVISQFSPVHKLNPLGVLLSNTIPFAAKTTYDMASKEREKRKIKPLVNILETFAPIDFLKEGLPFFVGLFESDGKGKDIINYLAQTGLGRSGKESQFKKIQSLHPEIIHDAIMASAALPYIFQAKRIEGKKYRDGGMGNPFNEQGNTPAQPLLEAGCTHLIVSLLNDGSVFDRHNSIYKDTAIIEVRPKKMISTSARDMLAFTPEKIKLWMAQGYDDAKRCIGDSRAAFKMLLKHEQAKLKVTDVLDEIENDGFSIV